MTIEAIYQHYEGTDAQCAAIQIERELAWATDITPSGALRYLDCSGNIHYINGEGGDQFWEEGTIRDEFGSPTFIPAVQYKGIGGDLDAPIVIGAQGRLGYDSFDGVYGLRLQADTGSLKLRSTGDEVNISGRYVNQSASQGINILASGVYDGSQKISLMAYGGSATYRSSNDTNIQADSGDVNIYAGIASAVNISGRSGVNIIGLNSSDVTYDAGTHTMTADCGDITIRTTAGSVNLSGNAGVKSESDLIINTDVYTSEWVNISGECTFTGFSSVSSSTYINAKRIGNTLLCEFSITGTSDSSNLYVNFPYRPKEPVIFSTFVTDNGTRQTTPGYAFFDDDGGVVYFYKDYAPTGFTASGTKTVAGQFFAELDPNYL